LECVERLNAEGQRPRSPCLLDSALAGDNQPEGSAVSRAWGYVALALGSAVRMLYNQVQASSNEELPSRGYRGLLRGPFVPVVPLRR